MINLMDALYNWSFLRARDALAPNEISLRCCWICFSTELENPTASWVHPCRCRGSMKWVHQSCINKWIDQQQRGDYNQIVACPQCKTQYILAYPKMNCFANLLEMIDRTTITISPWIGTGAVLIAFYWTAATYGALTLVQVLGREQGFDIMNKCHGVGLLIVLPSIPIMLGISKLICWESQVLRILRNPHIMRKFPGVNLLYRSAEMAHGEPETSEVPVPYEETPDIPSSLFGALILPSMATIVGNIFFRHHQPLARACLGAMTYIGVKGIVKIYIYQKQYCQTKKRRVANNTESFSSRRNLNRNN